MGYRRTITVGKTFPVMLSWTCSNCGNHNVVETSMTIKTGVTTGGNSIEAEKKLQEELENTWKDTALDIIKDPRKFPEGFRNSVNTNGCKCAKCNKKESWIRKQNSFRLLSALFGILIPVVLFSGLVALSSHSWKAITVFAVSLAVIVWPIVEDKIFQSKFEDLSDDLTPKIVPLNNEIMNYVKNKGNL